MKCDKEVVLAAVKQKGDALKYPSNELKNDKDFLFTVFKQQGLTVTADMTVKELMLAKVTQDGNALQFACDSLKEDREVVKAAVGNKGSALKFAKGGLNQDEEMLKASGLWNEEDNKEYPRSEQAILSVKFSLAEQSTPYATNFALAMKEDPFLGQFKTYNPNAWCKRSCDPDFTNIQHPCRGTSSTCKFTEGQNLTADTRKPCATSCWRFAFRFHQEESKAMGGFMIQVEESAGLGD